MVHTALPPDARLGSSATIVQFSSAFCQPCRATRQTVHRVVDELLSESPYGHGIEVIEIDADDHLDLTRAWRIESTPTVIFLAGDGHEVVRATGQPRTADVVAALARAMSDTQTSGP
jgi:thiol-disulfide isomerase/thioredoxin